MNGCIVIIDNREPGRIKNLQWEGAITDVKPLPVGDFKITTPAGLTITIERKTPGDLLNSIADGRLLNQAATLGQQPGAVFLLIEGMFLMGSGGMVRTPDNKQTGWQWASLQGALLSVQEMGIPIVYDNDIAGAIARLVNRSHNPIKRIKPRKESTVWGVGESIVASLPGIGWKRAAEFIDLFKNPAGVLTVLTAPNQGIPGWGEKRRQNLIDALGARVEIVTDLEESENG